MLRSASARLEKRDSLGRGIVELKSKALLNNFLRRRFFPEPLYSFRDLGFELSSHDIGCVFWNEG